MFSSQYFILIIVGAVITSALVILLQPLANRLQDAMAKMRLRRHSPTDADAPAAIDALTEILAALNCEGNVITNDDGHRDTVTFDFQGGHFVASIEDNASHPMFNTVSLSYYGCMSAALADSETLERVVNEVNLISLPPKATITPAGNNDNNNDALNVNLHISGLRLIADKTGIELFKAMLTGCFHIQRMLSDRFDELRRTEPSETVRNSVPYDKALYALYHAELEMQGDSALNGPWYEMPQWTIGEFFKRLYGYKPGEDMTLIVNGQQQTEVESIEAYPVFSLLLTDNAGIGDRATIDLLSPDTDRRSYHICLTMQSVDERLYLIHADCTSAGLPARAYRTIGSAETEPDARSVVIGIHRGGPEMFKAEAEFMAQEQGLVDKCVGGDAAYSLYWGRVLFADGRLLEAEHYLRNAWSLMADEIKREGIEQNNNELAHTFEETCFFLGQLYYRLGRYADSYLYMDMIVQGNRLRWTQQYILTLQALNDPRLQQIIRNLRDNANPENQSEETVEAARELMAFLDRRAIVEDIKRGFGVIAHDKLMKMLEANPDDEFALSWLSRLLERDIESHQQND